MSLLKFLSAGPSFVGLRDNTSRYQMRSRNPLPKFISPKNPFAQPAPKPNAEAAAATGKPAAAKMETGSLFEPAGEKPAPIVAPPREIKATLPRPGEPVKVEIKRAETRLVLTPPPAKPSKQPRPWFAWIRKLNPLAIFSGNFGARRNRAGHKPVQAEMSLERVQVVRNDLRDTDLEIVPGRLMGLPSGASPVLDNPARPDTGGWSRMTTKVFGLEHTHI